VLYQYRGIYSDSNTTDLTSVNDKAQW